jgi:subtilisin family serine protease
MGQSAVNARAQESFAEDRGVPVRVAVIDSGVHADHPHINGVSGGVAIESDGRLHNDYVDRLGHGTAVMAVIREKVPKAELFAVKVFHRYLSSRIEVLVKAIRWAVNSRMQVVNLSLGTDRSEHEKVLSEIIHFAGQRGTIIVSAYQNKGVRYLPGSLPGVLPVLLDWDCPRSEYRPKVLSQGRVAFCTSGYPIDIPGVSPSKNLKGISFSVAHMTGFVARILMDKPNISFQKLSRTLVKQSVSSE